MTVRALSIDFWNTLVVAGINGQHRRQQRLDHVLGVARAHLPATTEAIIQDAFAQAGQYFDRSWKQDHCTPTTSEIVRYIWDVLKLQVDAAQHTDAVRIFEEGILSGPPTLAEGVADALAWAAERYRLAIISDTMFSPGRVIRRLLAQQGVLQYFDACLFSDETGFSKPDVRAFKQAGAHLGVAPTELVHIGDLRRTDVTGARNAGAGAILYTGVQEDTDATPVPDAVLAHWRMLPDIIDQLRAR